MAGKAMTKPSDGRRHPNRANVKMPHMRALMHAAHKRPKMRGFDPHVEPKGGPGDRTNYANRRFVMIYVSTDLVEELKEAMDAIDRSASAIIRAGIRRVLALPPSVLLEDVNENGHP